MKWILARTAYEGYRKHTGGKSLATGQDIPEWDDLKNEMKDAWAAAIVAVRERLAREIEVQISNAGYDCRERLCSD